MDYKNCPHHDKLETLVEQKTFLEHEEVGGLVIDDCLECKEKTICALWLDLAFAFSMNPQIGFSTLDITIDTLNKTMKNLAFSLARGVNSNGE